MLRKALDYADAPHDGRELLILGTCLPEQIIHPDELARQLGSDVRIHLLATPAASTRLFYLVVDNFVEPDARVEAILVPYGRRDLTNLMAPWESQVMELAGWEDIPLLAKWACDGELDCALEMGLRKASWAYRYRGFLANRFWQAAGTRAPIPGYVLSPGAVDPKDDPAAPKAGQPPPQRRPGEPGPEAAGAALGWERPRDAGRGRPRPLPLPGGPAGPGPAARAAHAVHAAAGALRVQPRRRPSQPGVRAAGRRDHPRGRRRAARPGADPRPRPPALRGRRPPQRRRPAHRHPGHRPGARREDGALMLGLSLVGVALALPGWRAAGP
ncbi:MAG: hypothetical protein H6739_38220 [Alphaproteobacteria bacterium]|nr:hypothetical protein [Alphaproteobacteria bacterium]